MSFYVYQGRPRLPRMTTGVKPGVAVAGVIVAAVMVGGTGVLLGTAVVGVDVREDVGAGVCVAEGVFEAVGVAPLITRIST